MVRLETNSWVIVKGGKKHILHQWPEDHIINIGTPLYPYCEEEINNQARKITRQTFYQNNNLILSLILKE